MRALQRNKSSIYFALFDREEPIYDEYGNESGETEVFYKDPVFLRANVSPASGRAEAEVFGENLSYDKVIVVDNLAPKIDEFAILWIDTMPEIDEDGHTDTPHDYIVKRVAKSLNSTSIAVSKVNVR